MQCVSTVLSILCQCVFVEVYVHVYVFVYVYVSMYTYMVVSLFPYWEQIRSSSMLQHKVGRKRIKTELNYTDLN